MYLDPASDNLDDVSEGGEHKATKRAVCVSLGALSERAEKGDQRAQELLIESIMHLEHFLIAS